MARYAAGRTRKNGALFALIFLNFLATIGAHRERRYLVYPDGGPARAQFIVGLGIPVDLKEASVTVGTVIKFQYNLPTNSTEYTSRIYGFANTVARQNADGSTSNDESENDIESDDARELNAVDNDLEDNDSENDTLVDITFDESRRRRSLIYSEGGAVNSIDDASTELPLAEAIRRQEEIDEKYKNEEPQRMNRWDYYQVLQQMVERYGFSGRPCLLRTICEAAEVPFNHENGLLAEIGHILFTPSTTNDELSHHTDNEFHAAEQLGRSAGDCESLFPECESSILETFTEIGETTLHSFGF